MQVRTTLYSRTIRALGPDPCLYPKGRALRQLDLSLGTTTLLLPLMSSMFTSKSNMVISRLIDAMQFLDCGRAHR